MKKVIKIDKKTKFKIDTSLNWLRIYRDTFGHDILPDLVPMLDAVFDLLIGKADSEEYDALDQIETRIMEMETVTIDNVIWALAKNADEDVPEPEDWDRQFDKFPLDEILPQVFNTLSETYITTKKSKLLKEAWETRRSALMQFLSPESKED